MKTKTVYLYFLLTACLCLACEKDIKLDLEIKEPRLVIIAHMDNLSKVFTVNVSSSKPLTHSIIPQFKKISIKVFEERVLMFELNPEVESHMSSVTAQQTGLVIVPGRNYQLEVKVDNYPVVTSEVKAPSLPLVANARIYVDKSLYFDQNVIWNLYSFTNCQSYFKANFDLFDLDPEKNYYSLSVKQVENLTVAVDDRLYLGDNPEAEADGVLMDPSLRLFSYRNFIFSDLFLKVSGKQFNFFIDNCVTNLSDRLFLELSHFNTSAYRFHRSALLQSDDFGFFSEPINIESNVTNGYGSFAISSSVQIPVQVVNY